MFNQRRFKLNEGVIIGEIQAATGGDMNSWYGVKSKNNPADWLIKGKPMERLEWEVND